MTQRPLTMTEQLKVWRATGLPITLSPEAVRHFDQITDEFCEGCLSILEEARRERLQTIWMLRLGLAVGIICVVLTWAPRI